MKHILQEIYFERKFLKHKLKKYNNVLINTSKKRFICMLTMLSRQARI